MPLLCFGGVHVSMVVGGFVNAFAARGNKLAQQQMLCESGVHTYIYIKLVSSICDHSLFANLYKTHYKNDGSVGGSKINK